MYYQSKSSYMNKAVPAVALLFVYLEAAYDLPVSVLTYQLTNTHHVTPVKIIYPNLKLFPHVEWLYKLNVAISSLNVIITTLTVIDMKLNVFCSIF